MFAWEDISIDLISVRQNMYIMSFDRICSNVLEVIKPSFTCCGFNDWMKKPVYWCKKYGKTFCPSGPHRDLLMKSKFPIQIKVYNRKWPIFLRFWLSRTKSIEPLEEIRCHNQSVEPRKLLSQNWKGN